MSTEQIIEQKHLENAVDLLSQKGYQSIKADLDNYDKPVAFSQKNSENTFVPDLTAVSRSGKCYFEIVTKDKKDQDEVISRWKLFSTLATMRNGKFVLLVTRGMMRFTMDTIQNHHIEADVMKL